MPLDPTWECTPGNGESRSGKKLCREELSHKILSHKVPENNDAGKQWSRKTMVPGKQWFRERMVPEITGTGISCLGKNCSGENFSAKIFPDKVVRKNDADENYSRKYGAVEYGRSAEVGNMCPREITTSQVYYLITRYWVLRSVCGKKEPSDVIQMALSERASIRR